MTQFWLLYHILLLIVAINICANTELRTQQGIIYGRQTQNSIEYLGSQYAKVNRWKPPMDLASQMYPNGSLQATSVGPCCPQTIRFIYIPEQDEQCLYLNIYKPIVPSNHSLLPVFVWIHGGGHKIGCSSQSIPLIFNGTNMIAHSPPDQPVIIITINYRLGILADMFLKELIEEDPEWPTAGDPSNISLFGKSAGGLSVVDLGAVKGSAGLYQTAISESGLSSPGTYASYYNTSDALNYSNSVVQRLNCTNADKQKLLACIRNASIEDLLQAYGDRYTRPIIDNYFFPFYPPLAIQNGQYSNISLVMGNNYYEQPICFQHPDMNYTDALALISQSLAQTWIPSVIDCYHLNNCSVDRNANNSRCCNIVRMIFMDKIFDCDIRRIFDAFYLKYGTQFENDKLFSYHISCYPDCSVVPNKGICQHGSEQQYVLGTESDYSSMKVTNCTWDNQMRAFSNEIIAHWINTATTGRPLSSWPSYDSSAPKYFNITPDEGFLPETWNRNCSFFDAMEAEGARETFGNNNHAIF